MMFGLSLAAFTSLHVAISLVAIAAGFLVVIGMGIMLFFLLRNMNKQFKKIGPKPEETDAPSAAAEPPAIGQTARVVRAIEAGPASNGPTSNTVQTGDAKQDAKDEGATAKRK